MSHPELTDIDYVPLQHPLDAVKDVADSVSITERFKMTNRTCTWLTSGRVVQVLTFALVYVCTVSSHGQFFYQPSSDYYRNDTAQGTVVGGALGAISGALIGGKNNRGEAALIGAGVGALTGNLLGRNKDRNDEYRAATGSMAVSRLNQHAAAKAVTNFDLIRLTQAGVSDELIINAMRTRGGRLDLSPQALISLRESGVSERVMIAAQEMSSGLKAATVVTEQPPATVIVSPAPRRIYRYVPHHHHHYPRRARLYRYRY